MENIIKGWVFQFEFDRLSIELGFNQIKDYVSSLFSFFLTDLELLVLILTFLVILRRLLRWKKMINVSDLVD